MKTNRSCLIQIDAAYRVHTDSRTDTKLIDKFYLSEKLRLTFLRNEELFQEPQMEKEQQTDSSKSGLTFNPLDHLNPVYKSSLNTHTHKHASVNGSSISHGS